MDKVDILIIGAGIIGLAVADSLSPAYGDILLVEKEESFGRHCSSRNSEVIHSGIYYPQNSLKARLCVEGNELLYRFLEKNDVSHKKCGKLVVAFSDEEGRALEKLFRNGIRNNVPGLRLLDKNETEGMLPEFHSGNALWVPSTGIFDSHQVMKILVSSSLEKGAVLAYHTEVGGIHRSGDGYVVRFRNDEMRIWSRVVINCAGMWSDRIAEMAGMERNICGYRIYWNKGEYYRTSRLRNVRHLVYPVPDPGGSHLGIHTVSHLNGDLSFGPNSYYVSQADYSVDDRHHRDFFQAIRRYVDISYDDIWPDMAGIRPKLQGPGEAERDFVIANEEDRGFPNFINLIGIESPGLTCCLSIADYVQEIIL